MNFSMIKDEKRFFSFILLLHSRLLETPNFQILSEAIQTIISRNSLFPTQKMTPRNTHQSIKYRHRSYNISEIFDLLEDGACVNLLIQQILNDFDVSIDEFLTHYLAIAASGSRVRAAKNLIKQCENIGGLSAKYEVKVEKTLFGFRKKNAPVEIRMTNFCRTYRTVREIHPNTFNDTVTIC